MTRSIDNAFVRALSRKASPAAKPAETDNGLHTGTRIERADTQAILRVEQPEGSAGPHVSFQARSAGPEVADTVRTDVAPAQQDLSAILSFSVDTQVDVSADIVPLPQIPVTPTAPPQPHINAPASPQAPPQQPAEPSETEPPETLNQAAVEEILRAREQELNAAFQRRLADRVAAEAASPEVYTTYDTTTIPTVDPASAEKELPGFDLEVSVPLESPKFESPIIDPLLPTGEQVGGAVREPEPEVERQESTFQPAWEVDEFQWPELVQELLRDQGRQFAQAGEQLQRAAQEGLQVLGVTSTFRGEGRTSLTMCIARCVAMSGGRVVMVDMDPDRAHLATTLRVRAAVGWRDVVSDGLPLEESVIHSVEDGVSIVALDAGAGDEIELKDPRVGEFIEALRQQFDLVLLDCGPLVDENRFLAAGADCPLNAAIVVRDLRTTTVEDCQTTVARLLMHGVEAVGIAENFTR